MTASIPAYLSALAILAAIGIVALLYWLKPPPKTVVIPSSLVWDRVLRESHPRSDRLRWWLSFLLAALIAVVLVVAIVPPQTAVPGKTGSKLVVVLDDSPTMATRTTDGGTRWSHAVARARALIGARPAGSEFWLADTMRRVVTPGFQNRDDALSQLSGLGVTYGLDPVVPLPPLSDGIETMVITDGVSIGPLPARAKVESVFESVENAGVTAFEVRALPADPRRQMAYVEVLNAGGTEKRVELSVAGVGGRSVSRFVAIAAGGVRGETIDLAGFNSGPLRASIAMAGDGFAADDVAYSILPARPVVRVALVTDGDAFLEKSLRAQPRTEISVIAPARYADDRNYDFVVFDRFAPKTRPRVPALLFRPSRADWLPPPRKQVADTSVIAWNALHPLLENVSLVDLSIDRAVAPDLRNFPSAAVTVLARGSGDIPLIVVHEVGARWVSFAFAPDDSNFVLHAGFPIFLSNALNWMLGEPPAISRGLGLVQIPLTGARILASDGKEIPSQALSGGSLFEADSPGLFTAVSARHRLQVAVNLVDRRISDVNRSSLVQSRPGADVSIETSRPLAFDAWRALLLVAILLMLFEWWSWNRRLTV